MEHSTRYIVLFAAAVCGVCSIFVAASAVSLKDLQERNQRLDVQTKVLLLAGLLDDDDDLSGDEIEQLYDERIAARAIEFGTGEYAEDVDPGAIDPRLETSDPSASEPAPPNAAQVRRLPNRGVVYHVKDDAGAVEGLILPIHGKGLWSTLYGFLRLDREGTQIEGISYYQHGEKPGLGGEVDTPRWHALWRGRKAFDQDGDVAITVKKGQAGPPEKDPHHVDGLSGATITSRGVTNMLAFWLSQDAFGPYLEKFRAEMSKGGV